MCRLYDVSRSGYYAWCHRQPSQRVLDKEKLLKRIESLYWKSDESYGSPRVHGVLKNQGERVNRKRIERLMRENGIRARSSRLYRANPGTHAFFATFDNEILEQLASAPDRIWVGDVTYLHVGNQKRFLAVVMDKFSRRIVGWAWGKDRTTKLTIKAFNRAFQARRPKPGLIFHSDRGMEYCALAYQKRLASRGIVQSMNRPSAYSRTNSHCGWEVSRAISRPKSRPVTFSEWRSGWRTIWATTRTSRRPVFPDSIASEPRTSMASAMGSARSTAAVRQRLPRNTIYDFFRIW